MNNRIFIRIIYLASILLITTSCDKYHAKKLAGTYDCTVKYHYWDMTPLIVDSTYKEDIPITQEGKNIIVLGTSIHIDSLWRGKEYYEGYIHNFMTVLFKNDSVYITRSGGGLGGNASWHYSGLKK